MYYILISLDIKMLIFYKILLNYCWTILQNVSEVEAPLLLSILPYFEYVWGIAENNKQITLFRRKGKWGIMR